MEGFCQKYCCNLPNQYFENCRILCQTLGSCHKILFLSLCGRHRFFQALLLLFNVPLASLLSFWYPHLIVHPCFEIKQHHQRKKPPQSLVPELYQKDKDKILPLTGMVWNPTGTRSAYVSSTVDKPEAQYFQSFKTSY